MRCVLQPDPGFPTLTTWQIDLEIAIFHKFDDFCYTRHFGKTILKLITLVLSKRRRGLLFLEFIFIQRGRPLIKKVRSDSSTIQSRMMRWQTVYTREVTRCTSMKQGLQINSDHSKIKFIKFWVNRYNNVGKKSNFYFLNSNSKIPILAFLSKLIRVHKKPYLITSTLVHFQPVARYPKENSIELLSFSFG